MAFGTPVAAAVAYSANNGTSVAPAYPTGITSTDELVMFVGMKPSTANGGTLTQPDGWTIRDALTGAGGYGTTLGADQGNTNLWVLTKDTVTGSETGNLTVTIGTNNISWAFIIRVPTDGGAISYGASDGSDTTAGNVSVTLASNPGLTAGDIALWAMCIPTDVTTPNQFSAHAISATGATFGTVTELNEPDSQTGNDIGGFSAWTTVSTGTASAAPTITATAGGTNTEVRGPLVLLRLRETPIVPTGDLDATETGSDTASINGDVIVQGPFAATETGSDTFAATGTVTDPTVTGTLAATEVGGDTLAATGSVFWEPITGSLAATETGSDAFASTGTVLISGDVAATETGSDVFSATGVVADQVSSGSLAATETGNDTLAASGTVFWVDITGSLAATETGNDTLSAGGTVLVQGDVTATEVGNDTFAATGTVADQISLGTLAATETGDDVFAASGSLTFDAVTGALAAQEVGSDVFAGAAQAIASGNASASEAGADLFGAYVDLGYVDPDYVLGGVTGRVLVQGDLAGTETGSDVFAATNLSASGDLNASETGQDSILVDGKQRQQGGGRNIGFRPLANVTVKLAVSKAAKTGSSQSKSTLSSRNLVATPAVVAGLPKCKVYKSGALLVGCTKAGTPRHKVCYDLTFAIPAQPSSRLGSADAIIVPRIEQYVAAEVAPRAVLRASDARVKTVINPSDDELMKIVAMMRQQRQRRLQSMFRR